MIEIFGWIMHHTQLLHNAARTNVRWHCETHNLLQLKHVPGMFQDGLGGFGCQPLAPYLSCQPPPDFHARGEMRVKGWHTQPNEAGKSAVRSEFRRVQSETMLLEMGFDLSY